MDSLITAAGRALASGNPFGALNLIAWRSDAPALALRGIAMAQMGDLSRAKTLLRAAERAFEPRESVARARCVVAQAEIAFASRDLGWSPKALAGARTILEQHGDRVNAAHARHLEVRRLLLLGRIDEVERALADLDPGTFPVTLRAAHELTLAGLAMRRLQTGAARASLARAANAAREARIPMLAAEVQRAMVLLEAPAARVIAAGQEQLVRLEEIETLMGSHALIVDACRNVVRSDSVVLSLATRPILVALARGLAEAWPGDVSRESLIARAFQSKLTDESHRARLRVEIARLRSALRLVADVRATRRGFTLVPHTAREVVVLAWPLEEPHAAVLALLSDGEAWSSSAIALALGCSQRTAQRALDALASAGRVQSFGRGRARRWITPPMPGFATALLLPASLPIG